MDEKSKNPNISRTGQVSSLEVKKSREVVKLLGDLKSEVDIIKNGLTEAINNLRLLTELPELENVHIADKTIDIGVARKNIQMKEHNANWVSTREHLIEEARSLVARVRDAMVHLYDDMFLQAGINSHVLSESDVNVDFSLRFPQFTSLDLAESPTDVVLNKFLPDFRSYLTELSGKIIFLTSEVLSGRLTPDQLRFEMRDLQSNLQLGLKYTENFLNVYNNSFPLE